MNAGRWNAKAWHRSHTRHGATNASPRGIGRFLVGSALLGILVGAGAAASMHESGSEADFVGICHATGSSEKPYVFIIVPRDSYEHGHLAGHDGDFERAPSANGCDDDQWVTVPADSAGTNTSDAGEETEAGANETEASDNETAPPTDEEAPAETNESEPATNETEPAPEEDDGNETQEDSASNESEPAAPPAPGDVAVSQSVDQDDTQVTLRVRVANVGAGTSHNVTVTDTLPNIGRPWSFGGVPEKTCVLEGRELTCWLGELAAGEEVSLWLHAYTDHQACGHSVNNTVRASSDADAESRNNAASASVQAMPC